MTISQEQKESLRDAAPGLLLLVGQLMQQLGVTFVTMDPDKIDDEAMGAIAIRRVGNLLQVRREITEGE